MRNTHHEKQARFYEVINSDKKPLTKTDALFGARNAHDR
jgi:hypothetical protein